MLDISNPFITKIIVSVVEIGIICVASSFDEIITTFQGNSFEVYSFSVGDWGGIDFAFLFRNAWNLLQLLFFIAIIEITLIFITTLKNFTEDWIPFAREVNAHPWRRKLYFGILLLVFRSWYFDRYVLVSFGLFTPLCCICSWGKVCLPFDFLLFCSLRWSLQITVSIQFAPNLKPKTDLDIPTSVCGKNRWVFPQSCRFQSTPCFWYLLPLALLA